MCVGFFAIKPWAEKVFPSGSEKVEISEEPEKEDTEVIIQKEETPVEIVHNIVDYRELQNALSSEIKEAQKKVVSVQGIEQGQSWNDGKEKETTGLIVGDNGRELLILSTATDSPVKADSSTFKLEHSIILESAGTKSPASTKYKSSIASLPSVCTEKKTGSFPSKENTKGRHLPRAPSSVAGSKSDDVGALLFPETWEYKTPFSRSNSMPLQVTAPPKKAYAPVFTRGNSRSTRA